MSTGSAPGLYAPWRGSAPAGASCSASGVGRVFRMSNAVRRLEMNPRLTMTSFTSSLLPRVRPDAGPFPQAEGANGTPAAGGRRS